MRKTLLALITGTFLSLSPYARADWPEDEEEEEELPVGSQYSVHGLWHFYNGQRLDGFGLSYSHDKDLWFSLTWAGKSSENPYVDPNTQLNGYYEHYLGVGTFTIQKNLVAWKLNPSWRKELQCGIEGRVGAGFGLEVEKDRKFYNILGNTLDVPTLDTTMNGALEVSTSVKIGLFEGIYRFRHNLTAAETILSAGVRF